MTYTEIVDENYTQSGEKIIYRSNTYELVSKLAYLIGVPKKYFDDTDIPSLKKDIYDELDKNNHAKIIRHLCVVRTAIEQNFKNINNAMKYEYRTLLNMPEYIPNESMNALTFLDINFIKNSNTYLWQHIAELNRLIMDRINNCKALFSTRINWDYIKDLFIMPNGLTEEGTKAAADVYYANKSCYPYQMYINWEPRNEGNILYCDEKFLTLLYELNGDYFGNRSLASDVSDTVKNTIYSYLDESQKVVMLVDCENSDVFNLAATLQNLDEQYTSKISSIILFDDEHTIPTWKILERFTSIPVEYILIERIKENKSLVDITLTARACKEHYKNNVDSFVIVSSDSDFWGLISSLVDARFLTMIEREKSGPDLKRALTEKGIFYCYLDDFYSGNADHIRNIALFDVMERYIEERVKLNVNEMLDEALRTVRLDMPTAEKKQFYDKYIKTLQMTIAENGDLEVTFKKK